MSRWEGKSRGGTFGYRFFIFLIKNVGIRFSYFFLSFIVCWFILFAPRASKASWFYSRKILKKNILASIALVYMNFYRFGQVLIDKIAVRAGLGHKYKFDFENYNQFINQLNAGGLIMIGAHTGNWEAGGVFFGDYAKKINVVMLDAEYIKIKQLIEKNTIEMNYKIIGVAQDNPSHIYAIKDALDAGEYVCFMGDRSVGDKSVFTADFMGMSAKFPTGPFRFAASMGAPVVFYFAMREKGMRYRFKFITPYSGDGKTRETENNIRKLYINALEDIVKQYPQQWFNFYMFWD